MTSSIVSLVHPKIWPAIGPTIAGMGLTMRIGGLAEVALLLTIVGRAERLEGCETRLLTSLDVDLPVQAAESSDHTRKTPCGVVEESTKRSCCADHSTRSQHRVYTQVGRRVK